MFWAISSLILVICAVLMALPFFKKGDDVFMPFAEIEGSGRKELREYKGRLLLALKELDFDYETSKLSKEDYKKLREKYQAETVQVMKELEQIEENWKELQADVSEEMQKRLPSVPPPSQKATPPKEAKFCSSCGSQIAAADRFCGSCGAQVKESKIA